IIGAIGSGLFARFGEVFEGFLPARRLAGDYFELNDVGTALVGRRGVGTFRLGDPIEVRVESIDKPAGKVELAPALTPRMAKDGVKHIAENRRARHAYHRLDRNEAGLQRAGRGVRA